MTDPNRRRLLAAAVGAAAAALSGCSLPRGAAQGRRILSSIEDDTGGSYAVYPVTRELLPRVADWPMTGSGPQGGWISAGGGRSTPLIRAGDRLDLVVWDASETSLLTNGGARAVPMSQIEVANDGRIFVPYLDRVRVTGMTVEAARAEIQDKLSVIAPSAQVQLAMSAGRANSVDLVGGVARPGTYPVDGMSVLELLAAGGGVSPGLNQPVIRLVRGGRTHVTTIRRLYENPALDTVLMGGDKVIVDSDSRRFIALGAAGREQIVPFPADRPTALEALAAVGGVNDMRADPKAVLILREYPAAAVADGLRGPGAPRVIFVIDMVSADGLFSAGNFVINPDDVIYVSESPLNAFSTVSQVVGSIFGLARQANNVSSD